MRTVVFWGTVPKGTGITQILMAGQNTQLSGVRMYPGSHSEGEGRLNFDLRGIGDHLLASGMLVVQDGDFLLNAIIIPVYTEGESDIGRMFLPLVQDPLAVVFTKA